MIDDSYMNRIRWLDVVNTTNENAPGGALLRITGMTDDGVYQVAKPSADNQGQLLINGPIALLAGDQGIAAFETPFPAVYESGDGTPAIGETWGAKSGEWKLRKGYTGFVILSTTNGNGLVDVVRYTAPTSPPPPLTTGNSTGAISGSTASGVSTATLNANNDTGFGIRGDTPTRQGYLIAASTTQMGAVTTTSQEFAGRKRVRGAENGVIYSSAGIYGDIVCEFGNWVAYPSGPSLPGINAGGGTYTGMSLTFAGNNAIFAGIGATFLSVWNGSVVKDGDTNTTGGLEFSGGLYIGGDIVFPDPPEYALSDLTDCTISSPPATNDILRWDGSAWVNYTLDVSCSYSGGTLTITVNGISTTCTI